MIYRKTLLVGVTALVGLSLAIHACSSSSSNDTKTCDPACEAGFVCNTTTLKCEQQQGKSCEPACSGANTICSPSGVCICVDGFSDCNHNVATGAAGDGCECEGSCNGDKCSDTPPPCSPTTVKACGDANKYCDGAGACVACPAGKFNCDGTQDCEADVECGSQGCETVGSNACASQSQFCDKDSKACQTCSVGTFNCDRYGGDCECKTGCDGSNCKTTCNPMSGCGDTSKFCEMGQCLGCETGRFNCDGLGGCECDGAGCDGDKCKGVRSCDYFEKGNPCGDPELWCHKNKCVKCSDLNNDGQVDFFNCNGTWGCECDKDGCNGHDCAGSCTGGECSGVP